MNFVSIIKKQSRLLFAVLCIVLFLQTSVSADPGNCEDCYDLPEALVQDCLDSNSCNTVPVNGNIWVLGLAGLVLAYVVYRKRLVEEQQ